jgi:FkbM family methyltransferase
MYDLSDREMIVGTIYPDVFMVIDKKDTYVSGRLMREGTS